jgi:carbamoyl-phosphate synthase small subunit
MQPALIVLADGTWFSGESFGADHTSIGEAVFNTSMGGYQEILTDPSYAGQLVTMTMPHIGNYGVNLLDVESDGVKAAGLIVRHASRTSSNWRATMTLGEYLRESGTAAITGVDTRAITRHLRDNGAMMGAIAVGATAADVPEVLGRIRSSTPYEDINFVKVVSTPRPMRVRLVPTVDPYAPWSVNLMETSEPWPSEQQDWPEVAVVDFGVKRSILKYLALQGLRVTLFPHDTTAETILSSGAQGVLLSNGPGDPALMDEAVAQIRLLTGRLPVFGICLGHQLLGRAFGGQTFKLRFGHRGPNQPVAGPGLHRVQITAQNHGYAVDLTGVSGVEVLYENLNDRTCEGLICTKRRVFSVQHHPEAGPGPHDALGEFEQFRRWIDEGIRG